VRWKWVLYRFGWIEVGWYEMRLNTRGVILVRLDEEIIQSLVIRLTLSLHTRAYPNCVGWNHLYEAGSSSVIESRRAYIMYTK
jgi:hypothetical protein